MHLSNVRGLAGERGSCGAASKDWFVNEENCRSLRYAPPDFLWNLVALMYFMRTSLRKGAHVALSSAVWQEIRVFSGRDDTPVWGTGKQQVPPHRSG
jgi:hypothetical protein